jgi:hypothetical protein
VLEVIKDRISTHSRQAVVREIANFLHKNPPQHPTRQNHAMEMLCTTILDIYEYLEEDLADLQTDLHNFAIHGFDPMALRANILSSDVYKDALYLSILAEGYEERIADIWKEEHGGASDMDIVAHSESIQPWTVEAFRKACDWQGPDFKHVHFNHALHVDLWPFYALKFPPALEVPTSASGAALILA